MVPLAVEWYGAYDADRAAAGSDVRLYRSPGQQDELEAEFFGSVVDGLVRVPPKLLIVERGSALQAMRGRPFDFVEYFSGSPEFRALFQRYGRLALIDKWEIYERREVLVARAPQ